MSQKDPQAKGVILILNNPKQVLSPAEDSWVLTASAVEDLCHSGNSKMFRFRMFLVLGFRV